MIQAEKRLKELELYVHLPFCIRKCAYCDFVSAPAGDETKEAYVEALLQEITLAAEPVQEAYLVTSVFLGGGTPSILKGEQIRRILTGLRTHFRIAEDAEISMEANPGTLTMEKLLAWKAAGINRLSIGLQSADDQELELLGRIHTFRQFTESYQMARKAGFTNLNVDIMQALPGQDVRGALETLEKVMALTPVPPEHLSVYSLIIEEGTPFYDRYHEADLKREEEGAGSELLPSEEEERSCYHETEAFLEQHGYERYEISNFALPGKECRHNVGYWTGKEYLGFGISASSCFAGRRFTNTEDISIYMEVLKTAEEAAALEKLRNEEEVLTLPRRMEEFMFLGLRIKKGISESEFEVRFGCSIREIYSDVLTELLQQGLIEKTALPGWKLTEKGTDLSNYVMAQFLLEEE